MITWSVPYICPHECSCGQGTIHTIKEVTCTYKSHMLTSCIGSKIYLQHSKYWIEFAINLLQNTTLLCMWGQNWPIFIAYLFASI